MVDATGLDGLAVGIPLAAVPVPLVVGAFLLLTRARPQPRQHLAFAVAWGAGAGALAALYANSWSIEAIADRSGAYRGELLGLTVVAPFVEEAAKGAAVLIVAATRRHWFRGPLDGLVLAATTAAGFAFTENILYIGRAFGEGSEQGDAARETAAMFLARGLLTPFAHPLFTASTGLALGLAVVARRRSHAVAIALAGYLVAVGLHAAWNGAAWRSTVDDDPALMVAVYFLVMAPLLGGLFVLGARLRRGQLRAVAEQLPWYVRAGWFTWNEPWVLASVTDRARQRRAALALYGRPGERALRRYQWDATALAELRRRTARGRLAPAAFAVQERALLDRLWAARPALADVLVRTLPQPRWAPVPVAAGYPGYGMYPVYTAHPAHMTAPVDPAARYPAPGQYPQPVASPWAAASLPPGWSAPGTPVPRP
jgi:RsiW-degrading membrane proteinase PrsW (M82 family)